MKRKFALTVLIGITVFGLGGCADKNAYMNTEDTSEMEMATELGNQKENETIEESSGPGGESTESDKGEKLILSNTGEVCLTDLFAESGITDIDEIRIPYYEDADLDMESESSANYHAVIYDSNMISEQYDLTIGIIGDSQNGIIEGYAYTADDNAFVKENDQYLLSFFQKNEENETNLIVTEYYEITNKTTNTSYLIQCKIEKDTELFGDDVLTSGGVGEYRQKLHAVLFALVE